MILPVKSKSFKIQLESPNFLDQFVSPFISSLCGPTAGVYLGCISEAIDFCEYHSHINTTGHSVTWEIIS